ncbi:WhiB family transcriptional regulator [Streptomyces sp. NBC_01216]|uniref:WhiB family transcriptional regulator n=1 Tax=Streptomyces sp. NBC_01216 TaxID=2903778 RepID=UPI002E0D4AD2|nr:WhiB family transcriptional regulator [Streptomyces sp. NBC_01216]
MTTTARPSAEWHTRAACAGADMNLWFRPPRDAQAALDTCCRCPVRAECLHDALTHETPGVRRYGIRGGLTGPERSQLPDLPHSATEAITALHELLATLDERTPEPMTTTPVPDPAPAADLQVAAGTGDGKSLPVGKLLAWGEQHADPEVQEQAACARVALATLRERHTADQELAALTAERERLEQRLADLAAREAELAPAKTKKKRRPHVRDYDARTVRTWAAANGVECASSGQIPKRVLDAWRAATTPA